MLSDVKHSTFTDMAQRQRARLITARSQDQNLLSVLFNSLALQKHVVQLSDVKRSKSGGTCSISRLVEDVKPNKSDLIT